MFAPMSPAAFAPFEGLEGMSALARDVNFRLLWCNDEYARLCGRDPEDLIGTRPDAVSPPRLASARNEQMRFVLAHGEMVSFYQFWRGRRWHTRIWPLDPEAFGTPGCFIVKVPAPDSPEEELHAGIAVLTRGADFGDLGVLSPRELEVFYYLAVGLTVADCAHALFRSPKTVGRHAEAIHKKMGYRNRADLVRDAVRRGIVAFTLEDWRRLVES